MKALFFDDNVFLTNETAKHLYKQVKDLPIVDYHCHLSPKEIYEDEVYDNIGEMWLKYDHYKWRVMRAGNIDEYYITKDAPWKEKFIRFAKAVEGAVGNPIYHWVHLELKMYFGIDKPLCEETAEEIWAAANKVIAEKKLSPRKLIKKSDVRYIATTDDITDSLEYHKLLKKDDSFKTNVTPSFRTDNLLLINKETYCDYIEKLSEISKIKITDIKALKEAVINRLDYFCDMGCKFSDVGIEYFPTDVCSEQKADSAFKKALDKKPVNDSDMNDFLGYMFYFLAGEYKKRNIIMQLHVGVKRNANKRLFADFGPDAGCDCIGSKINPFSIINMISAIDNDFGLPVTIIYPLDPSLFYPVATILGSFRNAYLGAAWWFNDHKRGIKEVLEIISENCLLSGFFGMLTDSRSFLSYARHDYFRRILCSYIGEAVESGEFYSEYAEKTAKDVCFYNINKLIGEESQ